MLVRDQGFHQRTHREPADRGLGRGRFAGDGGPAAQLCPGRTLRLQQHELSFAGDDSAETDREVVRRGSAGTPLRTARNVRHPDRQPFRYHPGTGFGLRLDRDRVPEGRLHRRIDPVLRRRGHPFDGAGSGAMGAGDDGIESAQGGDPRRRVDSGAVEGRQIRGLWDGVSGRWKAIAN